MMPFIAKTNQCNVTLRNHNQYLFDPSGNEQDIAEKIPATHVPTDEQPTDSVASIALHERKHILKHVLNQIACSDYADKELVARYMHHKYRRHCSAGTIKSAYTTIKLFLFYLEQDEAKPLREVSQQDIEAFVEAEQDRGIAIPSIRSRLMQLSAFFRFMVEEGIAVESVHIKKIRLRVPEFLPRAIEAESIKKILWVVTGTRNRAMILLLLRTGMRIGELLNTRIKDINLEEQKIMIYEARKTGIGRVVYFSEDARQALEKWLQERDTSQTFLFYNKGNSRLSYGAARIIFVKAVEKAGLADRGYSLHRLRHTFASELLNAGMRLECLQQLLGHTHIEMTRRYARLTDKSREEEYFRAINLIEQEGIDGHY